MSTEEGPEPIHSQDTALCATVASSGQPCTANTTELNPTNDSKAAKLKGKVLCLSMCFNEIQIPLVFYNMLVGAGGI